MSRAVQVPCQSCSMATGSRPVSWRVRAIRRFTVRPVLPEVLKPLGDLARNLRWSWHTDTQDLFRSIDPKVWDAAKGDPIRLLRRRLG